MPWCFEEYMYCKASFLKEHNESFTLKKINKENILNKNRGKKLCFMYYLKEMLIITTIKQMMMMLQLLNSTEYVSF